jgi:acyl dehydratase
MPRSSPTAIDAAVAQLRCRLGQEVTGPPPYLTEATRDAIHHWAEAIGDDNPLWLDAEYARTTRWGTMLAPPTMLYAFDRLSIGYRGGLPGVHAMFGGTNWTFYHPTRLGDCVRVKVIFKDLIERPSTFAGRAWQQSSAITFTNQDGLLLAESEAWGMRTERAAAAVRTAARQDTRPLTPATYTAEQIHTIMERYAHEARRGPTPRYWEDVTVGETLPPLLKGPYTVTTAIAFEQAWGGLFIRAHGPWYAYLRRHPAAGLRNAQGIPEPPEAVHWDHDYARQAGVPFAYDYGPERISWLAHLLTNWVGDDGFLCQLNVQVRRFNMVGDLTTCHGTVTAKVFQPSPRVQCEIWAENQRGERTAFGTATVELPSRAATSQGALL